MVTPLRELLLPLSNYAQMHRPRTPLESVLFDERREREDHVTYIEDLLARQSAINSRVLELSRGLLPAGSLVIDACAGPEGSFLAAKNQGYRWIGNDLSRASARNLKQQGGEVVVSDFSRSRFKSDIADGVFFVFSLNNISNPSDAIREASRVVKEDGVIVIAETGPSYWDSSILIYSLLGEETSRNVLPANIYTQIQGYFEDKAYSIDDYVDYYLNNSLGTTRTEMRHIFDEIMNVSDAPANLPGRRARESSKFSFHLKVVESFYRHLQEVAEEEGFRVVESGVMASYRVTKSNPWNVTEVYPTENETWLEELLQARVKQSELVPEEAFRAEQKIIFPVLALQRKYRGH